MTDEINSTPQTQQSTPHQGILNKTLGDILQNNPQAQNIVMKAMQISPQQLQEMLSKTGNNQLMNMSIGDMFKNGIMQQAASGQIPVQQGQVVQVTPEQLQQIIKTSPDGQISPEKLQQITGQSTPLGPNVEARQPQKQSFLQKLKGLWG